MPERAGHQCAAGAAPALPDDQEQSGAPVNGLQEPLLPNSHHSRSSRQRCVRAWTQGVQGAWMGMCGYLRDPTTCSWTDGGEPRPDGVTWCPQEHPSSLSSAFFFYANALMKLGARKHLEQEDLWDVAPRHQAAQLFQQYSAAMRKTARPERFPHGSVGTSLVRAFGGVWLFGGLLKFLARSFNLAQPFLLRQFLKSIPSTAPNARLVSLFWVVMMASCGLADSLLGRQGDIVLSTVRLSMRQSLRQFLYDKALVLSLQAKAGFGMGTLTNLLSNDTNKIIYWAVYGHSLWSAPFQLIVAMIGLTSIIGLVPMLCGLASIVVVAPLATLFGTMAQRVSKILMGKTDARIEIMTEVLSNIKAIKLSAWEAVYCRRVQAARKTERRSLVHMGLLYLGMEVLYTGVPIFVSMAVFGVYAWRGGHLTADVAFPALFFLHILHGPLMGIPQLVIAMVTARVSLKRLQDFCDARETPGVSGSSEAGTEAVAITHGTYAWQSEPDSAPILSDITLSVPRGALCMVVGEVGSGKSSLLAAMLGEMHSVRGSAAVKGTVAYTSQDPWIQNATVKENILMGAVADEARYSEVVAACALEQDLATLPKGDATEIGEKGVTLSGGQKHRVALARACYAGAEVALLDDPLSAVDAHVQRTLMQEVVCGVLGKATRVLVTHQLQFLPQADLVVKMERGRVVATGTYSELVAQGVELSELNFTEAGAPCDTAADENSGNAANVTEPSSLQPSATPQAPASGADQKAAGDADQAGIPEEERQRGSVKAALYLTYLRAWGPALVVPVAFLMLSFTTEGLSASQDIWLSVWTRAEAVVTDPSMRFYMSVYIAIGMSGIALGFVRGIVLLLATLRASQAMHDRLLDKVFSLPMAFFDTQPSGRLISRFSKDVGATDLNMAGVIFGISECIVGTLVSTAVVTGVTRGAVLLALAPLIPLYLTVQRHYLATSRELNRLQSVTSSPILSNFGETLAGLITVRAFRKQGDVSRRSIELLDSSTRTEWPLQICGCWLSIRLQLAGEFIVMAAALFAALCTKNAALAGLALTSAGKMQGMLSFATSMGSQVEMSMNSVERMTEYLEYDSEAPPILPNNRPEEGWPHRGELEVEGLELRYRPELPLVLKGVTFSVRAGEKVGVCGRTGCGKSTLLLALYRIVEMAGGSIVLDGIDIAAIGLRDLRRSLSFVAQDPVVFSGSVRKNLDPMGTCSDAAIATALQQAGLQEWAAGLNKGVDTELAVGGETLSVGQRQLLCMARALLKKARLLLMDEATSNVDNATDAVIQATIRSAFAGCTVLTIAHRLHTIIDSDRILVLAAGELVESGNPQDLMKLPNGKFRHLVGEANA